MNVLQLNSRKEEGEAFASPSNLSSEVVSFFPIPSTYCGGEIDLTINFFDCPSW